MTPDVALARLRQYGERTSTWSTATYNDGTEKALHQIAVSLAAEVDRLRAQVAELERATPAQIDAFLRAALAEDTYLGFQQVIGSHALEEAVEDAGAVRASADNDGLYNADWREGWDDAIERVDPDRNGPCPARLTQFGERTP